MESSKQLSDELPSQTVSEEPNAPDLSRTPPYWHEDGDVILVVEEDDKTKHDFRIHRLMLCLHSPVFRDMFSLGENAVKDEIPTIPMKGDSVEDVRELLRVVYKGYELYSDPEFISFEGALGVLRLSHKYQMEQLKGSIAKLLKQSWPLNYTEYNQVLASLSPAEKKSRINRSIQLINAAYLTECHELLPAAFFELTNSNCFHWNCEEDGIEDLCQNDWLRVMKGKVCWMARIKKLERAGISSQSTAYIWDLNRNPNEEKVSIFQTRSQFGACSGSHTKQKQNVKYCLAAFGCLESLVGRTLLDGGSLIDGCKSWTYKTFQSKKVCSGCSRWMASLSENKVREIWEHVFVDFDLPEVDDDEYTKASSKRSFF